MTLWNPRKAQWDDDDDFAYKTIMHVDGSHSVEEVPIKTNNDYKLLHEDTIKCADCNKKLIDVIKVKQDETQKKIVKVKCPCGGESFLYEITGHTYFQAVPGCTIGDIPTEYIDNTIHMTIKVIK